MSKFAPARRACVRAYFLWALLTCFQTVLTTDAAEWKEVFNPYHIRTLHLQMSTGDWERIRFDQPSQSEGWVPQVAEALLWGEGEPALQVTVRRKGESDIPLPEGDPQKVSLKIDINSLVPGQKWHGLTKLSLENGSDNPLTEGFAWIAHRLAWEAGITGYEAAYSGWVRLFINGELKGVFVNAEQRDAQFLRNHGYDKETGTWLYKVDGSSSLEVGIGSSPTYNHLCFPPFNTGPGGGGGGGGGCTQPNLEADLPQWINLRGFFTQGAVDAFLENRDALFSHSGKNSYAVDFDPPYPRTRLYFPWDQDTTIAQGDMSIYGNEPYQTQLLMHPWFRQVYEQLLRDLLDGPLSTAALKAVIDRLQATIGPAFDEDPYVYTSGSQGAFDDLRTWVDTRVANVRSQLTHPYIPRPQFNQYGGEVVAGFNLLMNAPTGSVYYTLDGTDPRAPGGGISSSARLYTTPVVIERTTSVTARSFDGQLWSALPTTATFNIARYASALRITEMMYHPATAVMAGDEDNYEFVELKNTGAQQLDLSGFAFEGISFAFPAGTILPPQGFFVLARNPVAFSNRYPGVGINGVFWGKLSDSGEKIRLRNSDGNTVISVEYDDDPPWPLSPDGMGYSLVLANPAGNPDDPATWRASSRIHGSPGADDPDPPYAPGLVINEVLAHSDPPYEDVIEVHNTGNSAVDISGWYLSDDFVRTNAPNSYDLTKYRIPDGTTVPAGGYKVFYARDFNATNTSDIPFALTEFGETVYLSSANSAGDLTGFVIGASFGASDLDVSIGRYTTSTGVDFVPLARTTFGADTPEKLEDFRAGKGALNAPPLVGPVVINEIMYNPTAGGSEFVELLSITNAPVDLSGWKLAGADFIFPTGTVLATEGLLLVLNTNHVSPELFRSTFAVPDSVPLFGHSFVLENEGEALRLEKPNASPLEPRIDVDRVRYNDKSPWPTEADGEGPSLERFSAVAYGNDPINWRTVVAGGSPGRPNMFTAGLAISKGTSWKYHALGSDLGTVWQSPDYIDSAWPSGDGVLGYGADALGSLVPFGSDPARKPLTVYFRKEFVVNDPASAISNLSLSALYDDGFVVYLNGNEVLRSASMPSGAVAYDSPANASYNSISYEEFGLAPYISLLRVGRNVLCVEVHQANSSSDDLLWDATLTFEVATQPTLSAPTISPPGGIFGGPVQVTIAASTGEAEIYYTLNGTAPDESSTLYSGPFMIESTTQVRARAYQPGYNESSIVTAQFALLGPGVLAVTPESLVSLSGTAATFTPASWTYTLTNTGGTALEWSISDAPPWMSLEPASGNLPPEASSTVTASVNSQANTLQAGSYLAAITFTNTTAGAALSRNVELTINPATISLRLERSGPEDLLLSLTGVSGQRYLIEASGDLGEWSPMLTNTASASLTTIVLKPQPNDPAQRFYRARVLP